MNVNKKLIMIKLVPKELNLEDIYNEIIRKMRFSTLDSKNLAGIIIKNNEDEEDLETIDIFIHFWYEKNIQDFGKLCKNENEFSTIELFGFHLPVILPTFSKAWQFRSLKHPEGFSNGKEVIINTESFETISDILKVIPSRFKATHPKVCMTSVTQYAKKTFVRFRSQEIAKECRIALKSLNVKIELANSYIYTWFDELKEMKKIEENSKKRKYESKGEMAKNVVGKDLRDVINKKNQNLMVSIGKDSVKNRLGNDSLTIGKVSMRELLDKFGEHSDLKIQLSKPTNFAPADDDTLIIDDEISFSDE
jgi:hypothetical protein